MIDRIIVPDLGATGGDVVVTEWLVKDDQLRQGGDAPVLGRDRQGRPTRSRHFATAIVRRRLVAEGETVAIGDAVAILADSLDEPIEDRVPAEIVDGSRDSSRPGMSASKRALHAVPPVAKPTVPPPRTVAWTVAGQHAQRLRPWISTRPRGPTSS